MLNKMSIKFRITLLTAVLLSAVCLMLTFTSIKSAGIIFFDDSNGSNFKSIVIEGQPEIPNNENLSRIEKIQEEFASQQVIYMVIVICIGTVLSYYLAGRALKPITNLSKEMNDIDEHRLKTRINVPDSNDEVSILANSFNQLLLKLDNAFESQKLFTQNVAHELKTPLTSIMANIDVLEMDKSPSNEELLEVVGIAKKNIERLSTIVSDVLSINSYIDKQNFKDIDFFSMVTEIENELSNLISEKKITVIKKGNTVVYGNKSLLYRAFYNLILNAIRYNKNHGEIEIICDDSQIMITDTGIGIPESSLDKIFEPFYCVDSSRSRLLGGSGLGLPMVKSILDKHNLKIKVESELNVGTKMIITF